MRQINQDYFIAENRQVGIFQNVFIVADGVGSNRDSYFASKHCSDFVLEQLERTKKTNDPNIYVYEIEKAYRLANTDIIYRIMANPTYKGMGTTMVLATIVQNKALIANVGDSRCYHINDTIEQITCDHSVAEELVKANAITKNSPKYFEYKHQLSRAFGSSKKINTDFFEVKLKNNDYILLCSDGLHNMVSDEKIFEIIKRKSTIETKVNDLINLANANGGKDNITVVLLYIDDLIEEQDENKKQTIKDILLNRANILAESFKHRSRKKIEDDILDKGT